MKPCSNNASTTSFKFMAINKKKMKRGSLHLRKYRIGTIRELKAARIRLRKYPGINSIFPNFFDGALELPELIVDGSIALINLVAYEMCPDFRNSFEISSFLVFMSSLIDQPKDVKELRMPWTIIALMAARLGLVLTFIQT
ncbi:hypothetical protein PIB30_110579 [Stylosanthes scabra]|uniref:Uncharacterized protein n=1 Tax=Stylosanthes scabra TaxID=79078 RepID=A0ABU6XZ55_9FABA|nr:hypothetical protein [Stylosanthes scabra]